MMANELNKQMDVFEHKEEIKLTEDIGGIQREDTSSILLFGDNIYLDDSDDESSIVSINDLDKYYLPRMLIIDGNWYSSG